MTAPSTMRRIHLPADDVALYDVAKTREIERAARSTLPAHTLMRRAGEAVARLALALAPHAGRVDIAAGPGDNGGDGLLAGARLQQLGRDVRVTLLADPARHSADARDALAQAQAAGVRIDDRLVEGFGGGGLLIDALLGIGASRAPGGAIADTIARLNAANTTRLAVDVPSGLGADTGQPLGDACVRATHTLTLIAAKPGLYTAAGRDHAGEVWLDELGVDTSGAAPTAWLSGEAIARRVSRRHAQHKGSFGDIVVVGGAPGMAGAALLAGRAALAAGAGRVYVCPLDADAALLDASQPELMLRRLDWAIEPQALAASTVVAGCGGGTTVRQVLPPVVSRARALVVDADGLNAIASDPALAQRVRARAERGLPTVLTPHPLEAARLLGCDARQVQADRINATQRLADRFACTVLLKGSGTVVAAPGRVPHVNATGTAALASAGTGDVLAGWIGGSWASAHADDADGAFGAAIAAAWEHGAAANAALATPLTASRLIDALHDSRRVGPPRSSGAA